MRDRRFRGLEGQSFPRCCALETAPQIASCASTATESLRWSLISGTAADMTVLWKVWLQTRN